MKALEILKHYVHSIVPIEYSPTFVNEAIKELEELENRSCSNCKHYDLMFVGYDEPQELGCINTGILFANNFCCKLWEKKA